LPTGSSVQRPGKRQQRAYTVAFIVPVPSFFHAQKCESAIVRVVTTRPSKVDELQPPPVMV
jgi:hypothetical protein